MLPQGSVLSTPKLNLWTLVDLTCTERYLLLNKSFIVKTMRDESHTIILHSICRAVVHGSGGPASAGPIIPQRERESEREREREGGGGEGGVCLSML